MNSLQDLINSLANLEFGGMPKEEKDEDITKQLSNHYKALICAIKPQYTAVSLNAEDFFYIEIDGVSYHCDTALFSENSELTEHKSTITEILSELSEDGEDINELLLCVQEILCTQKGLSTSNG